MRIAAIALVVVSGLMTHAVGARADDRPILASAQRAHSLKQYDESLRLFQAAAKGGDPFAIYMIGLQHLKGQGVKSDPVIARMWLMEAAKRGNFAAMTGLGEIFARGLGVDRSSVIAVNWYGAAAQRGDVNAMRGLGNLYNDRHDATVQDYKLALRWYQEAADRGDAGAMIQLGAMYRHGRGVQNNGCTANAWYEKAAKADLNDPVSRYNLGVNYRSGLCGQPDLTKARVYLQAAAQLGDADAKELLAALDRPPPVRTSGPVDTSVVGRHGERYVDESHRDVSERLQQEQQDRERR